MSLEREQFYNKAIRPNLAHFSSDVKVREILPHLPCLTISDRDEIEAKRDSSGNFTAMQTLLDNLRRREKWPEEFINALRNCEKPKLADKLKAVYDEIKGITNAPKPAPPPAPQSSAGGTASVTKATIHNVPPTTPPLLNRPQGDVPADSTPPSSTAAPKPAPAPENLETQEVQVPPPVPAPSPKPVTQEQITPPAEAPSQQPALSLVSEVPLPVEVSLPVQQAVPNQTIMAENKTPVLNAVDGFGFDQTQPTDESLRSIASGEASASNTSQIQVTKPYTTSEKIQVATAVKDITSDKIPVQDTNPQLREERTFQRPEEVSDPTANEHVQRNNTAGLPVPTTRTIIAQPSSAAAEVAMPSLSAVDQECFSKPGILQDQVPEQNRAETRPILPEEPCSVVSSDLQFSERPESSTESTQSAFQVLNHPPNMAAPLTPNHPEENHYESICEGQTMVNVVRYAEEPSAENFNGQPPSMMQRSRFVSEDPQSLNHIGTESVVHRHQPSGHAKQEPLDHEKSTTISSRAQESVAATPANIQPEQREEGRPELFRINNFHLIAAAGIGLSAVFLAWRLKN